MGFSEWTPDDDAAAPVDVTVPGQWDALLDRYTNGRGSAPLSRVFDIAQQHGVVAVLIERRYIDLDWRSEHSRFYSTTFVRYPSVCHRLHFFIRPLPTDLGDLSGLREAYCGYSVMRPLPSSPVGRTMIPPPPELDDGIRCEATDTLDVLGWPMTVTAMPFVSQDAQYLRCAHADMWMTFYLAHLSQGLPRRLPAEIHDATMGGVVVDRQVPSQSLSQHQMLGGLNLLGLSPGVLPLPRSAVESQAAGSLSLFAIMCRYVNSNLPPIVCSTNHVWLVVGYTRAPSAAHTALTLYRHDDASGPYIRVEDPWNEPQPQHRPWTTALLPLPPKIYMTAERAEAAARLWFDARVASASATDPMAEASAAGELTYQLYGLRASAYKQALVARNDFDPAVARAYRTSMWPRSIWVVEAVDRRRRKAGAASVLGEVIIDPTANHDPNAYEPGILAVHGPGLYVGLSPDRQVETRLTPGSSPYRSGRQP